MPDVTQYRNLPAIPLPARHWINGVARGAEPTTQQNGWQRTQSFRSGKTWKSTDDGSVLVRGEFEQTTGSRLGFMHELRERQRPSTDNGHAFWTEKQSTVVSHPDITMATNSGLGYTVYKGYFVPYVTTGTPALAPAAFAQPTKPPDMAGRFAIQQTIPTRAEASLAVFLGEVKERLPSLIGYQFYRQGFNRQSAGGEYLNVEFGIRPMISEIQKMARSVLDMAEIVRQMQRDSERVVRRKLTLQDDRTLNTIHDGPASVAGISRRDAKAVPDGEFYSLGFARLTVHDEFHVRQWFSGAYSYLLSEADNYLGKIWRYEQLANKLLGTRITPDVVWELTPWSWLIDWVSDTGVFVSNISALAQDNLVLRYGYLMTHTNVTRHYTVHGIRPAERSVGVPRAVTLFTSKERKERVKATPYGFGLKSENFSLRQWAILGALGMTKGPRTLA